MPNPFHTKIRQALADTNLQEALDANSERRFSARQLSYASLSEDVQLMRQRAKALRTEVIDNLDEYLEQFSTHATTNGVIVHQATDANEAVQIVLQIVRQKDAKLIAKSKSMVSEEIALNHHLEANGIKVVETDLGEYIVQLRGEPPAHIITPAVHLRRGDVGRLFAEKLGIPYTEDIPTLTAAARRTLRKVFFEAEIGISGVNFGVAESGTLCIVTNEGNGRMVTTLPPVHIALMGIERLVPTFRDLALMLDLLPRSATGQKLSVYTSLINGPRRRGETDGCQERHLILLDNGRNALRGSQLAEALLCIRCGACLNVCPVFREIGGHAYVGKQGQYSIYPGPIGSVIAPGLFGVAEFGQLARASSLCGACKEACPVDIDLPKMLLRVRAGGLQIETQHTPKNVPVYLDAGLRTFSFFAVRKTLFGYAQNAAGFFSRLTFPKNDWLPLPAFTGWGYSKDFPRPVVRPFSQRWAAGQVRNVAASEDAKSESSYTTTPPKTESSTGNPQQTKLERFTAELNALGGNVIACQREELGEQIGAVLKQFDVHTIQAWEPQWLPPGLLEELSLYGVKVSHQSDPKIKAGLTGSLAGIAESGTVIIPCGLGRPLTASLTPEIHLVILNDNDIHPTLSQALALQELRIASATILITGPSRTADIEMALTIGVHGPGNIYVFCLK